MTIEVGNHPDMAIGAVLMHSTDSGQFLACGRDEFEALCAAVKRGEADGFLGMADTSFVPEGGRDWVHAAPAGRPVTGYRAGGRLYAPEDVEIVTATADGDVAVAVARERRAPGAIDVPPAEAAPAAEPAPETSPPGYEEMTEGLPPGSPAGM